jgi:hypothetical protein
VLTKDGAVTRTLSGRQAGEAESKNNQGQFNFRFNRKKDESVGASLHSHPKANSSGVLATVAPQKDVKNEYPSSTDLRQTMHKLDAPMIVKTPSGAIREAYRLDGVDHLRTLVPGQVDLGPIPRDISDNFVVDP